MASTLYIQLPSKSMADAEEACFLQAFPFCLASNDKHIVQQGHKTLLDLRILSQTANQVVILIAASDVNVIALKVPPMPLSKLRLALPNMMEEQLLGDPSQLFFICNAPKNGQATVAVIEKNWLETLFDHVQVLQAKKLLAYSLSSTMLQTKNADTANIIIEQHKQLFEISVRSVNEESLHIGTGLCLNVQATHFTNLINTIQILAPQLKRYVIAEKNIIDDISQKLDEEQLANFQFQLLDWQSKIAGIDSKNIDLFSVVNQDTNGTFDFQRWKWSLILGVTLLVVSMMGVNWKWWKLHKESSALRTSITQIFKSSFPNERVVRDPLEQMRQKISTKKKEAGQSTSEDFIVMASQFSSAWDATMAGNPISITSMEYKEKQLIVQLPVGLQVNIEQLRTLLKEKSLKLESKETELKISVEREERQ